MFIHEYGWSFPIGVDEPDGQGGPPLTMQSYHLRGTPSCLVLDRQGRLQLHHFGRIDDLALGALLGRLIASPALPTNVASNFRSQTGVPQGQAPDCATDGCRVQR